MDISSNAIEWAKRKAVEKQCSAQFQQADMCNLSGYDGRFDTVIDIGCLHSLFEEQLRQSCAETLHRIYRQGAMVYIRTFSSANPKSFHDLGGPPTFSKRKLRPVFPLRFSTGIYNSHNVDRKRDVYGQFSL